MTSILRRIVLILKSWLHSLMASAEDPRQEFASAYRRQQELLSKVQQAQANVATSRSQLSSRIADSQRSLAELQGRARQALVDGQEKELGYFTLSELQSIRGPGGLKIERDAHFNPTPISELRKAACPA